MSARLGTLAAALAAALLAAPAAAATTTTVTMSGRHFEPSRLTVVAGDTVVWRNDDVEQHTVVASTGAFASTALAPAGQFTHTFDAPAGHAYVCTLHPFMRGSVEVAAVVLTAAPRTVAAARPVELRGRTAPGAHVRIESVGPDGGATTAAAVTAAADGSFAATVQPERTATYRAVVALGAGAPVEVVVVQEIALALDGERRGGRLHLTARITPPQPGALLALQLYSRERFAWRQVAHRRLAAGARAQFRLRGDVRRRARLVLYDRGGGPPLAMSRVLRTRALR